MKISDYLCTLKDIFYEQKVIRAKIDDDEDKTPKLILSLLSFYEHMKPILMYIKEILDFVEATSKFL